MTLVQPHGKALGILAADNKFRLALCRLLNWKWFDRIVLTVIIVNSVILGIADYSNLDAEGNLASQGSWRNTVVEQSEPVFTTLFTVEMTIKILAMGFIVGPGTYLRDGWNVLDFIVVVAG